MSRGWTRAGRWLAGASLALALPLAACGASPRARNVLVITLDTMRADRLPPYGFSGVATPALERLAAEGALFEQAFASVPLTLPSHATLFTGLYPQQLGVRDNAAAPLSDDFHTLAERLKERGLRTGAFVASMVLGPKRGLAQGFDLYSIAAGEACPEVRHVRRPANAVVDEALGWLAQDASVPFFAWLHFYDTHRPYRLPDEYTVGYSDPYTAAIAFEDAQISRVVAHLEAARLLDTTLIVVVGDHGESLGDHGEDSHGVFIYQETLRVPLIVRGPGVARGRVDTPVRLVDLTPTIVEMMGGMRDSRTPSADGVTLAPLMLGKPDAIAREVYAESLYPERFGWARLRSLRADRYKVIEAPRPELYDLATDPGEKRNIFASSGSVGSAMLARLRSIAGAEPEVPAPPVDKGLAERLASLGYASNPIRGGATTQPAPDPKDMIGTFNEFTSAQAARATAAFARRPGCGG